MMDCVNGRAVSRQTTDDQLMGTHDHGPHRDAGPRRLARRARPLARPDQGLDRPRPDRAGPRRPAALRRQSRPAAGRGGRRAHRGPRPRRPPPVPRDGPRRAPGHPLRRFAEHGVGPDRVLRERQRREPARLAHRLRDARLVGRRLRGRPVQRRILAHRRPVPHARHHRLAQAARGRRGRRVGRGPTRRDSGWAARATARTRPSASTSRGSPPPSTARKSWFFVGDEIVCLGAGITASDGVPVESVVDHRNLGASRHQRLHRRRPPHARHPRPPRHLPTGPLGAPRGPRRLRLPRRRPRVRALREERTGTWKAINTGGTADPVTRRYLTLWFDHGTDPTDASYAYVLLPGARQQETAARAADRDRVRVLANSAVRASHFGRPARPARRELLDAGRGGRARAWTAPRASWSAPRGARPPCRSPRPSAPGRPSSSPGTGRYARWPSRDPRVEVLATGRSLRLRITPDTFCGTARSSTSLTRADGATRRPRRRGRCRDPTDLRAPPRCRVGRLVQVYCQPPLGKRSGDCLESTEEILGPLS